VEFANFEPLFYIQPLVYLVCITSHFLLTALLHKTGLTQQTTYIQTVAEVVVSVVMK
jgi:hypothetical protein